ncbi:ATP-binding cassette domain-containing protein, partial [Lutibacter sp.]
MAILEIDSVEMWFGENQILSGVYLKAEKGIVTGILGGNGCGKTTLLRIIFGELNPKMKSLRVNGKTISYPFLKTNNIKFLPQFHFLPKSMKVKTAFK